MIRRLMNGHEKHGAAFGRKQLISHGVTETQRKDKVHMSNSVSLRLCERESKLQPQG